MTDLTEMMEWLRGIVRDDLAKAREAANNLGGGCRWAARGTEVIVPLDVTPDAHDPGVFTVARTGYDDGTPVAEHIATHDPADTIARCEAELRIVDQYERITGLWKGADAEELERDYRLMNTQVDTITLVARLLAYGYRHRPGWQEGWKP